MEKGEHFCTVGGNVNWFSHSRKQYGSSSKKLRIELPYDPAIALPGIYLKDTKLFQRGICTPMFIATLSTMANYGKSPNIHQLPID